MPVHKFSGPLLVLSLHTWRRVLWAFQQIRPTRPAFLVSLIELKPPARDVSFTKFITPQSPTPDADLIEFYHVRFYFASEIEALAPLD